MGALHDPRWRVSDWWFTIRRGRGGVASERVCGLCEGGEDQERAEDR